MPHRERLPAAFPGCHVGAHVPMTFLVCRRSGCARSRSFGHDERRAELARALLRAPGDPEEIQGIDLSSWRIAFTPEPVKRTSSRPSFASSRRWIPGRGLLSMLMACREHAVQTGGRRPRGAGGHWLSTRGAAPAPRGGAARSSHGAGGLQVGQPGAVRRHRRLAVVSAVLPDGHVGEIWQIGWLGHGRYWANPSSPPRLFGRNRRRRRPVHATGDLGFLRTASCSFGTPQGPDHHPRPQLLSGRYRVGGLPGRPSLRPGGPLRSPCTPTATTPLVVVAEVQRTFLPRLETRTLSRAAGGRARPIADLFGCARYQLILIRPGSIPKTSSGKLRRRHTRELHQTDRLDRAEIQQPEAQVGLLGELGAA